MRQETASPCGPGSSVEGWRWTAALVLANQEKIVFSGGAQRWRVRPGLRPFDPVTSDVLDRAKERGWVVGAVDEKVRLTADGLAVLARTLRRALTVVPAQR